MHYIGDPRREWLALGPLPPIVGMHNAPKTHVGNAMPYSDGQGMFPTLYVHLIEMHIILNS